MVCCSEIGTCELHASSLRYFVFGYDSGAVQKGFNSIGTSKGLGSWSVSQMQRSETVEHN